jgi:predicted esterase
MKTRLAVILLHGRGGAPEDLLELADEWNVPDIAYLAPAAAGLTWYPESFLAPIDRNEPWLTSALRTVERVLGEIEHHGVPARHARRYRAVVGLSAGLIGPPGTPRAYGGSLAGTSVFLGCSDIDPHIPLSRVHESADVFRRLDGVVDERIYPDMGHSVNRDEVEAVKALFLSR